MMKSSKLCRCVDTCSWRKSSELVEAQPTSVSSTKPNSLSIFGYSRHFSASGTSIQ